MYHTYRLVNGYIVDPPMAIIYTCPSLLHLDMTLDSRTGSVDNNQALTEITPDQPP